MRSKFLIVFFAVSVAVIAIPTAVSAVTVVCVGAPDKCTPTEGGYMCPTAGNPGNYYGECAGSGSCVLQGDLVCDDVFCGAIVRPVCDPVDPTPTPGVCGDAICDAGAGEDCSSCSSDCGSCGPPPPACGNGNVNGNEQCDDGGSNGTCPAACSASCTLNSCGGGGGTPTPPPPPSCGNGNINGSEQCDDGGANGACPAGCSTSCTINSCNATCTIQGFQIHRITPTNLPAFPPGTGTTTINGANSTSENPFFFYNVPVGTHAIAGGPHSGFNLYGYTICSDGTCSNSSQIPTPGSSINVSCPAGGGTIDMRIQYNIPVISVSTNHAGASWSIPGVGSGSGTGATYSPVSSFGTYSISLGSPAGYTCTPDAWSKNINDTAPSATFIVTCSPIPPTLSFQCDGQENCTIPYNSSTTLGWSTQYVSSCSASGGDWSGGKIVPTGSELKSNLTSNKTYTISCSGPGGTVSDTVNVTVLPALSGTITSITSPRNTILTSNGQSSGTISGTMSGGSGTGYQVNVVIRTLNNCQDWIVSGWANCLAIIPAGSVAVSGATWWTGAGVPPLNQMTSSYTYQVFLQVGDSTGSWSGWISGPAVLMDTTAPTGTISTITSPAITVLTSDGSPLGTIVGTAFDSITNVTGLTMVIREWNGIGSEGACDGNNRDWNGSSWQAACTAGLSPSFTPGQNITWSFSGTPPAGQMTYNRRYHIYLLVTDAVGNNSGWNPNVSILYAPNQSPTVSNVKATEPNYCTVGPSATISWSYADADGSPQGSYQVQVDNDAGFTSPVFDTGKVSGTSTSVYASSGLAWGTTYYSRVKVWDATDLASPWTTQTQCQGPPGNPSGCLGGNTGWTSPSHAYPSGLNTFSWTPTKPPIGTPATFSPGSTTCYSSGITPGPCSSWLWSFGDTGTSTLQSPTHTYAATGTYPVNFSVSDGSYTCAANAKNLTIQQTIPSWIEILPR